MDDARSSGTSPTLLGRLRQDPADTAAWSTFVLRYGPRIHAWCQQWRLQEADAQDVTQNVLVKLLARMRTFNYDRAGSFRGWLKTVTYHRSNVSVRPTFPAGGIFAARCWSRGQGLPPWVLSIS
jgi:RNA polymerase sigma-70 factor (ECF subfamily)